MIMQHVKIFSDSTIFNLYFQNCCFLTCKISHLSSKFSLNSLHYDLSYLKTRSRTTRSKHRATLVGQSANPVQIWDITHCLITKMVWSPCGEFLAIGNEEGSLILLNWLTREKVAEFRSYFGAIIALAWSPDSK